MPIGVHEVVERVSGGGLPVRGDPQDLAGERTGVLGRFPVLGVAGGDVQVAVGAEGDPSPVVGGGRRDTVEDHLRLAESPGVLVVVDPGDPVVGRRGVVHVDMGVLGKVRVHGQPEQPALTSGRDPVDRSRLGAFPFPIDQGDLRGVALGDQRRTVGEEVDPPGHFEVGDQVARFAERGVPAFGVLPRARRDRLVGGAGGEQEKGSQNGEGAGRTSFRPDARSYACHVADLPTLRARTLTRGRRVPLPEWCSRTPDGAPPPDVRCR